MIKTKLLKHGDISQIAGIKELQFTGGKAKDTAAFEIYNAAGLRFTVLKDKCLDIFHLSYKGTNLSFQSKNSLINNRFFNGAGNEFIYYWNGGMICTCGLSNCGQACTDNGEYKCMHGRIGATPASNTSIKAYWQDDDYIMAVEGEMRESALFGCNLVLRRRIETSLYSKEIRITDTIENLEPKDEEFMLLYHINFGYPLVSDGTYISKPKSEIIPLTKRAANHIGVWDRISAPIDDEPEQCFFHKNRADKDGNAYVGVINKQLMLGAYVKYSMENLPWLLQWKSMKSHDYALGIEPTNTVAPPRTNAREKGELKKIEGYGKLEFKVSISVIDGEKEIQSFEESIGQM